ncbi:VWA domain-containing protein [Coralloluteibacterium thermophilus]|uniref:VWA domain-containing protein n=2 Tax=Coralloluteibacterium thermophilum TaxID=2707049 RepID=A0ABV9NR98_9GAMM
MVDGLVFLRPAWLLLLLGLPLLAWLWRRRRQADAAWRDSVDPHLLPHLLDARGGGRRDLPLLLAACVLVLATFALAGPSWRHDSQPLWRPQAALVVALDLSSSMLAEDIAPSRIARVRYKLAELLETRRGGQVGLVVYADDAFVVSPLTEDAATVRAFLDALSPDIMPVDGQRPERAIARAVALMENAGFATGTVLVITDSAGNAAGRAAAAARGKGFTVSVLGVGTEQGAPVTTGSGFLADRGGGLRMPRLDPAALRELAAAGGGRYAALSGDREDLETLGVLDPQAVAAGGEESVVGRRADGGIWLVLALLPLALLAFRRGWLMVLAVVMVLPVATPAQAGGLEGAFRRADQRARDALEAGDVERARSLARDPALAAAAAYRAGDHAAAAAIWERLDGVDADYNRGNALARAGDYEAALAAYDAALARDPGHEDAEANRRAVQEWLERQPPQPQEGGEGGQDPPPEPGPGEDAQQGQGDSPAQPGQDPQQDADAEPGDADGARDPEASPEPEPGDEDAQREAEAAARAEMERALAERAQQEGTAQVDPEARREDEQRQAVEQWLRRVPDDPGGLLRRKFELEHRRRQLQGDSR